MAVDLYAVDPGGTIGVARVHPDGHYEAKTFDTALAVVRYIDSGFLRKHVVIEDFSGAGRTSSDGKRTMNQVGGFTLWCQWEEIPYTLWAEQRRLSSLAEAREIVLQLLPKTPANIRKHAIDAMAHAVAWRRSNRE
jgi:hypothetical protein